MKIGVIDFDARQMALADELMNCNQEVYLVKNIESLCIDFDVLVLPIRGCNEDYIVNLKEGNFNLKEYVCMNSKILIICGIENVWLNQITSNVIYLMNKKEVIEENAELTAQCLLAEILKRMDCNLKCLWVDVVGYGNCGSRIASLLSRIVRNVRVIVKNNEYYHLDDASKISFIEYENWVHEEPYSLIINTAPSLVITKGIMEAWKSSPFILDIASNTGGVDYEWANLLGIQAMLLPTLPSIYTPNTAGKLLARAIVKELTNE